MLISSAVNGIRYAHRFSVVPPILFRLGKLKSIIGDEADYHQ